MSARDPNPMLQAATTTYANSKQIAIIGPPNAGKTVIAGLLYDSIVNKFLPTHKTYRLQVENGLDFLQRTMLNLKKGEFPAKTPADEINKVEMILRQDVGTGGKIEIKLHDVVGETYEELYIQELPKNERLFRTLEKGKQKGQTYGDMAFLIFAKLYVVLVDCEKVNDWAKISYDNVKLVNTILQWKEGINQANNGKIKTPIAIMFTKTDLLNEEMAKKSGEELLKEFMPEFYQQLNSTLEKPPTFCKVRLEVDRSASNTSNTESTSLVNYKVRTPIKYSDEQYVELILWIDQNMQE